MPRRNFGLLLLITAVSLLCYQKVQTNRYGRTIVDAMDQIERRYLEPIDASTLFEGAMEGLVSRLDEYSAFISRSNMQEFEESIEQKFGGVGMEVAVDPKSKQLTVMSPLVGSPAYEAGIRAGDKILRIDDYSTQGLSLKDAVARMRGDPGDAVQLLILHEGETQPVEIKIVRAVVRVDTVLGDTRNSDGSWNFFLEGHDRVGYVRVNSFAEDTVDELQRALDWLTRHKMRGLILDLRNDPGGLLKAATDVCDLFIDSGVIVTIRPRDGQIAETHRATGNARYTDFPMVALVNQYSASASEIVAACLQDHGRATIVGQRTWGKGTVQEVLDLEDHQGALKLTTASYWRPSGKNIHRGREGGESDEWGVMPNDGCQVVVEGEELNQLRLWRVRRDVYKPPPNGAGAANGKPDPVVDRQLAKALQCLEKVLK